MTFLRLFDAASANECYRRQPERRAAAGAGAGEQPAGVGAGARAGGDMCEVGTGRRSDS